MLCCGIYSYKDLKQYIKNYLRIFDIPESKPLAKLDTSNIFNSPDISNEWENISTPRGQ